MRDTGVTKMSKTWSFKKLTVRGEIGAYTLLLPQMARKKEIRGVGTWGKQTILANKVFVEGFAEEMTFKMDTSD